MEEQSSVDGSVPVGDPPMDFYRSMARDRRDALPDFMTSAFELDMLGSPCRKLRKALASWWESPEREHQYFDGLAPSAWMAVDRITFDVLDALERPMWVIKNIPIQEEYVVSPEPGPYLLAWFAQALDRVDQIVPSHWPADKITEEVNNVSLEVRRLCEEHGWCLQVVTIGSEMKFGLSRLGIFDGQPHSASSSPQCSPGDPSGPPGDPPGSSVAEVQSSTNGEAAVSPVSLKERFEFQPGQVCFDGRPLHVGARFVRETLKRLVQDFGKPVLFQELDCRSEEKEASEKIRHAIRRLRRSLTSYGIAVEIVNFKGEGYCIRDPAE